MAEFISSNSIYDDDDLGLPSKLRLNINADDINPDDDSESSAKTQDSTLRDLADDIDLNKTNAPKTREIKSLWTSTTNSTVNPIETNIIVKPTETKFPAESPDLPDLSSASENYSSVRGNAIKPTLDPHDLAAPGHTPYKVRPRYPNKERKSLSRVHKSEKRVNPRENAYSTTAKIGCSNIKMNNNEHTVFLGVDGNNKRIEFTGFKEATVTPNLYALNKIHIGRSKKGLSINHLPFYVNGDSVLDGNLKVNGNIDGESGTFNHITASTATINTLHVQKFTPVITDKYVEGNNGTTVFTVLPKDGIDVIYINPIRGPVAIQLGSEMNYVFEANRVITFQDVTPIFPGGSSHNATISVPTGNVKLEYYGGTGGMQAGTGGTYILGTSGGAVTYRYVTIPGTYPTWLIQSQNQGNARLTTSPVFIPASEQLRANILRTK